MTQKHLLKISKEVASYLLFNDLASRYLITPEEAEVALRVLKRNEGSHLLQNGDFVEYTARSWVIRRK